MSGTSDLVDLGENITNQAFQSSASENDKRDYLSDLPLEMLDMIINNMDLKNALKMGKTSKLYYNLIQNNETRRNKLCQKEFLTDYSKVSMITELWRMCLEKTPFLDAEQKFCTEQSNICKFVFGDFSKLEKLNSNNLDGTYTIPESVKVVLASSIQEKVPQDVKILHIPPSVQAIYDLEPVIESLEKITGMQNVREIKKGLFQEFTSLTSVTLPDSLTIIPEEAFQSCRSLASIIIPDSVTHIDNFAFENCTSLTTVILPDSVKVIDKFVFGSCISLTSITIPDSVKHIGSGVFENCISLTSITIPNSVKTIPPYAFENCTSLASIIIPDSVTVIDIGAFRDCTSLASITIPDSVTDINSGVFGGCSSLASITIPDSVTYIGNAAFKGCTSLTSITIPAIFKNGWGNRFPKPIEEYDVTFT